MGYCEEVFPPKIVPRGSYGWRKEIVEKKEAVIAYELLNEAIKHAREKPNFFLKALEMKLKNGSCIIVGTPPREN